MEQNYYLTFRDGMVGQEYIRNKLVECGITEGDTVMVSCRLPFLGKPISGKTYEDFSVAIIDQIMELIGPFGTIVVPAYSYSFCRKEVFDVKNTPSSLGTFFEVFRKMNGVVRTIDPIFSVCIKGPFADFLSSGKSHDCFGEDSFFDRFHSLENAKFLLIGLNYHYITNFHYIEQSNKVSYRFIKEFPGKIVMQDGIVIDRVQRYFVRHLDQFYDFNPFFEYLDSNGIGRTVNFGNSTMKCVAEKEFWDIVTKILKSEEAFFLEDKQVNNLRVEK